MNHCFTKILMTAAVIMILPALLLAGEKEWIELTDEAVLLYRSSHYDEAVKVARQALKEGEKTFGKNDLKIVGSVDDLATYLQASGKTGQAKKLYDRALKILEKNLPGDDAYLAIFMDYLAGKYEAMGDPYKADKLRARAKKARAERLKKTRSNDTGKVKK